MDVKNLSTVDAIGREYDECSSSGLLITDGVVIASNSQLRGVVVLTDGTNDATVIIYDSKTEASGNELFKITVSGAENIGGIVNLKVKAENGIFISISGTGAEAIVYFVDVQ